MTIVNSSRSLVLAALRRHPWFEGIPEAARGALAAHGRWLRFAAGDTLFSEGQSATSCLLVCEGWVQGLRYTADGGEKVFGEVGPGGWLSVLTLFESAPRHLHHIRAHRDGSGCLVPHGAFLQLCRDDGRLACRVASHGAWLVRHHTDRIDWLTSSSAQQRLAEYVLRAGKPRAGQPLVLPLSHSQIAVKLGMRAETLSRIFARWRREGIVANRQGKLYVLCLAPLEQLAAGGAAPASAGR